ncbi:hypothetical protein F1C10_11305 [Sphingomonas sp. NBWT7]|uniref:hypothetical protein n=1 Tax=Sphingomonas sp. NBWT7 TaxID=2596913 RepID=UPI001628C325|nr:hypothetical protein [Sphingomonas sp. NBWT7]QNE32473.1 hypothetical protein F1C10_11305 [Sphingomonas sp. NBWT7]
MAILKICHPALLITLVGCSAEPGPANAAAIMGAQAAPAAAKPANEAFADYWQRFRKAALADDAAGLIAASAATVKTHGTLDSDEQTSVARAAVPPLVRQALASDTTFDARQRTLRQALESSAVPKRGANDPLGYRRVGAFVFEQRKGRWYLTEIYREE